MDFHVPNKAEPDWKEKYKVNQGQYLCWFCNHPQYIRTLTGYLVHFEKCGSSVFYGMK